MTTSRFLHSVRFPGSIDTATVLLGALLLGLLTGSGCVSYQVRDFKERSAGTMINRYENGGFMFSASLELDPDYLENHFGRDLTRWDIFPVLVYLENRSEASSFDVRVSGAEFQLSGVQDFDRVPVEEVVEEARLSRWRSVPGFLLGILPGFFVLHAVSGANRALEADYNEKLLEDISLPPGGSVSMGVVFFRPVGKELEECDLTKGRLVLRVTQRGDQGGRDFDARFSFE